MVMQQDKMTEQESLRLINEMIGKAKRSYVTKGIASIVWGVLIILCSLLTWIRAKFGFTIGFDPWMLIFLAVIPQVYFTIKEKKERRFIAHDEATMSYVWSAFGVCIFILSFYNARFGREEITSLYMMLYGLPTFITGGIFKFKPMIYGGLACWLLAICALFTSGATAMLFVAICGLVAWLIPGIILWNRYKKQEGNNV